MVLSQALTDKIQITDFVCLSVHLSGMWIQEIGNINLYAEPMQERVNF